MGKRMNIEHNKTTIFLEGNEEHRAFKLAMCLASELITVAQKENKISPELFRAGAYPQNMVDLVSLREIIDRLNFTDV